MAEACRTLSIPITGGNVSFYNDTLGKSIDPTPIVGVLGLIENAAHALTMAFRNEGDAIVLLDGRKDAVSRSSREAPPEIRDQASPEFSSSEYARTVYGIVGGLPPAVDLAAESRLIEALVVLASEGILASAHDVSDGGIAVALAECGFTSNGLTAEAAWHTNQPAELALFSETGARAVVSLSQASLARLLTVAAEYKLAAVTIGRVTRGKFRISLNGTAVIRDDPASLQGIWSGAIERAILGEQASKQL
jgi:phosphoribosylformylglycinamidine synthase subunit PurL